VTTSNDTYTRLIDLLERHGVPYRLIDHAPEGRTEIVSAMRGHDLTLAAKCMVVMVKVGRKVTRHVLAVVPGHAKVDLNAIKELMSGTYVSFTSPDIAESLSGSVAGTILPFAFHSGIDLLVDPAVLERDEMFFNAARLDRSMALKTRDYMKVANPRIAPIATYRTSSDTFNP
jgi:Ala-tRNA(Pro) deacylase